MSKQLFHSRCQIKPTMASLRIWMIIKIPSPQIIDKNHHSYFIRPLDVIKSWATILCMRLAKKTKFPSPKNRSCERQPKAARGLEKKTDKSQFPFFHEIKSSCLLKLGHAHLLEITRALKWAPTWHMGASVPLPFTVAYEGQSKGQGHSKG